MTDEISPSVTKETNHDSELGNVTDDENWLAVLSEKSELGHILYQAGNLSEAESINRAVIKQLEIRYDPNHPDTLTEKCNLACVLEAKNQWHEAKLIYLQVLYQREKQLGVDHLDTLLAKSHLAGIYRRLGNYIESESTYKETITQLSNASGVGPNHPITLTTKCNYANLLNFVKKNAESEVIYTQILKVEEELLGPCHLSTLITKHNLAAAINDQGRFNEAEALYRDVLYQREIHLGQDDESTMSTRIMLANVLKELGKQDEADELFKIKATKPSKDDSEELIYKEALESVVKELGMDHEFDLIARCMLAERLNKLERPKVAESILIAVIEEIEEKFAQGIVDDDNDTKVCTEAAKRLFQYSETYPTFNVVAKCKVAEILRKMGKKDKAVSIYRAAVADFVQQIGPEHRNTLTTKGNLANLLSDIGKLGEAEVVYKEVILLQEPHHRATWVMKQNLALCLYKQGKYQDSRAHLESVLESEIQTLGNEAPETLNTMVALAMTLFALEDKDKALSIIQEAFRLRKKVLGPNHSETLHAQKLVSEWKGRGNKCSPC